ncbi:hypothetical protein Nepgr_029417 [Nepenthes gracilis]|uniref:Uncharacterized protein n=1 Tax=Nepenthes gracilis TaxID=150966 RepID=A0AAD3TEG3_NEPGR|nr:hypothetical protein Nepgr_029417 [Nepenthes gracilis]
MAGDAACEKTEKPWVLFGMAVAAAAALILWGFSGSNSSGGKMMKAPGRDGFIRRSYFESDPAGYFRDLHKK